ncbi:MAG TPA: peptidylprolyl isomerase [Mycobacteriales bacterium]|nr:peptidylprolyl isomerase [Mycobacteriales bacterium]
MPTTKQRRENARRRLERQIQRRQEAAAARKRRNLVMAAGLGVVVVIAAVVLVVTQVGGSDSTPAAAPSASASASTATKGDCTYTKGSAAATKNAGQPPNGKVATTGTATVNLVTTQGNMTFSLDRAKAPCTVNSFVFLAGHKYYDGTPCHRVTTGATFGVLQCGDPGGTGSGGPGYTFKDELDPAGKYTTGVLAMANGGANTNGSQFFIVYKNTQLDPNYTIFGTVTKGLDVVDKVAKAGAATGDDGKPKLAITLKTVTPAS